MCIVTDLLFTHFNFYLTKYYFKKLGRGGVGGHTQEPPAKMQHTQNKIHYFI